MYEIEKGIEIPARRRGHRPAKYPWAEMEVGDSFFVPAGGRSSRQVQSSLQNSAGGWKKRYGGQFTARQVKEPEPGVRVWRVE